MAAISLLVFGVLLHLAPRGLASQCGEVAVNPGRANSYFGCPGGYMVNGLVRDAWIPGEDTIDKMTRLSCCRHSPKYRRYYEQCEFVDWEYSLERSDTWPECPRGHFVQGFYRGEAEGFSGLHTIKMAKCCKASNHPYKYGENIEKNVASEMIKAGKVTCPAGHNLAGFHHGDCDGLECLDTFLCYEESKDSTLDSAASIEDIKTFVMDITLVPLSFLAHYLGFGWVGGCRTNSVGENFQRQDYSWIAETISPSYKPCDKNGIKWDKGLKIHYADFDYEVKEITYSEPDYQDTPPEAYLSGTIKNPSDFESPNFLERELHFTRSVSHQVSEENSWAHELGIQISYTPPKLTGGKTASAAYKFGYENAKTETNAENKQDAEVYKLRKIKTVRPHSTVGWTIQLTKRITRISYTATIKIKFSAELDGFLRWNRNFHNEHEGSEDRPFFKYTFGSANVPLYNDLKTKSDGNRAPWKWNNMIDHYQPYAKQYIDFLTNENYYEFTLTGQIEDVAGIRADVSWTELNDDASGDAGFTEERHDEGEDTEAQPPRHPYPKPPKVEIKIPKTPKPVQAVKSD